MLLEGIISLMLSVDWSMSTSICVLSPPVSIDSKIEHGIHLYVAFELNKNILPGTINFEIEMQRMHKNNE